jgi:endonuclease YncB( thermonuclease family)
VDNSSDRPYWFNNIYASVTRVIDLDTIEVLIWDRWIPYVEKVRLANINALDSLSLDRFMAEQILRWRLVGMTVRLEFDLQQPQRDEYGRLVAFVWDDQPRTPVCVNLALLSLGWAYHKAYTYTGYVEMWIAETTASLFGYGVWNRALDWQR